MFLKTSVVMMTICASELMEVSPVSNPILDSPYFAHNSVNF